MAKSHFSRLVRMVTGDDAGDADEPLWEASLTRMEQFVHFWVLVWRSFVRNRCPVRASALSYTTLLAIIPMFAVAMSVSSVFLKSQGEEQIRTFIERFVENMVPTASIETNAIDLTLSPEEIMFMEAPVSASATNLVTAPINDQRVEAVQQKAASYIYQSIQGTYSGTLGVTGMIFLLVTAILMLTRIEETFNDIWGVTRGRNWLSRVVLYWATITLVPMLLVAALGLAGGIQLEKTRAAVGSIPMLEPVLAQFVPASLISLTFALFYKLMPNTKVNFSAALVGGVLAGTAWHVYNQLGFVLASRFVSASKLYGSLALVPLLMGGLYMVWVTVLFGAQVAYAFQNRAAYLQEKLAENVNQRGREFVALRLMTCIGQRFQRGLPPPTIQNLSAELGIPSRLAQQVLSTLIAARLVAEAQRTEAAYIPARPLDAITAHHILLAMRATQGQELVTREEPVREEIYGEYARIQEAEKVAAGSVTMLALVNRVQARLELSAPAMVLATALESAVTTPEVPKATPAPAPEVSPATSFPAAAPKIEFETIPGKEQQSPAQAMIEPVADEERGFPL